MTREKKRHSLPVLGERSCLPMKVARRLKKLREEHGLTEESVALAAGIDRVALSRMKTGKRCPNDLSNVPQLAAALGFAEDELEASIACFHTPLVVATKVQTAMVNILCGLVALRLLLPDEAMSFAKPLQLPDPTHEGNWTETMPLTVGAALGAIADQVADLLLYLTLDENGADQAFELRRSFESNTPNPIPATEFLRNLKAMKRAFALEQLAAVEGLSVAELETGVSFAHFNRTHRV